MIHAGDLTTQGSLAELRKTMAWIAQAPYEVKIIIAGEYEYGICREETRPSGDVLGTAKKYRKP